MVKDKKRDCVVRDGKFVEPCETLAKATSNYAPGFSRKKGIWRREYSNVKTHEKTRTFFGSSADEYENGICFNFCPFCGVQIDQPFNSDSTGDGRAAESTSKHVGD